MSFAKVFSAQTTILNAKIIDIEVDLSKGFHSFSLVGLPDKAVEESKDRVSAAIKNCGYKSPKLINQKIVISLAPADVKKEGPVYDLSIAVAYLIASKEISAETLKRLFIGELSLDGKLRRINGILPITLEARKRGFTEIFLPHENAEEAALVDGIDIYGAHTLQEVLMHINTRKKADGALEPTKISLQKKTIPPQSSQSNTGDDFADIRGQESAKRALEIAAAGGHNIAMYGPPGTGKTMLAKAFRRLLPSLPFEEMLEVTSIHSVAGHLTETIITTPPFRSPHHTSSHVSIVGGGVIPKPGEATLAHKGVLFLDEFPEFDRRVIEALRQPLEDRMISVSRARGTAHFPSHFILVAAMNPCPCGYFETRIKDCVCSPSEIARYYRKISGPIADRIDIWVEVGKIDYEKLGGKTSSEETESVRERVLMARQLQSLRFADLKVAHKMNSEMGAKNIIEHSYLTDKAHEILNTSSKALNISARSYHRIIKLARTIADLEQSRQIEDRHMLEALQYRPKRHSFM